ncbi:MAG TPA: anhydro-N-acetylmuramic acid kinase [Caldimonas sp.]|jgi:anhydro-N-acetylmuramic acid kinase|nr:anhydro-N-acetylmuramic acid kinase [Caldimonas sp.]HEX4234554.1 anhydro-N-acetylmuramic acid kinase [Caldimonas sp.]
MTEAFIGLMSGTSLDGIDGVVMEFGAPGAPPAARVLAHAHRGFSATLRAEFAALNIAGANELHRGALAANALAREAAGVVESLLKSASCERSRIVAIGSHGQTVRHRPREFDETGYTVQLNAPALLAERTGIDVVADFRSRDVAAGGHGAPLVPAFHHAMFGRGDASVAVLNLGGIANLTSLGPDGAIAGFDCGPANVLLDLWCERSTGKAFDPDGAWGGRGKVDDYLLDACLAEPYFALPPPKSSGRDLFNAAWLEERLVATSARARLRPEDVQATLAELTARSVADAFRRYLAQAAELIVCGGGARNADLMARLARTAAPARVVASDDRGLPADQVEAAAFAWLARAFVHRLAGNVAAATGAAGPRVLGALYPAR